MASTSGSEIKMGIRMNGGNRVGFQLAKRTLRLEPLEQRELLAVDASGPEFLVNTTQDGSQRNWEETSRSIAVDGDGDFVITWTSYSSDFLAYDIFAQRYNKAGEKLGDEFRVNSGGGTLQQFSTVAMDSDGDFVVAWTSEGQDGNGRGIFARRYDSNGTPQGSEFAVNTVTAGDQLLPDIAMDADGDFVITWQSYGQDGDGYGIYARRYNSNGTAQGSEFLVNDTTAAWQLTPAVAMDAQGNFAITWSSAYQDGDQFGIFAKRYLANGQERGPEFQVNSSVVGSQRNPSVALAPNGDSVITWSSLFQDGSGWGTYAQRYDNKGDAVGNEFRVNTQTAGNQQFSKVAMDGNGNFVITWASEGQDGDGWGIYGQRFTVDGGTEGDEFRINTQTNNDQQYPSVAMDPLGDFVATWSSYGQDGSAFGIYAQRYAANKPPDADAGGPYFVEEGDSLTLDASRTFDPDRDGLSFSWDLDEDGEFDDATGINPTLTWEQLQALGLSDGPQPSRLIRVRVSDNQTPPVESAPAQLTLRNKAPTIEIDGPAEIDAGEVYRLELGTISDPGPDTVTRIIVDWGDGTSNTYTTGGFKEHTYSAGLDSARITVDLEDEDGRHRDVAELNVSFVTENPVLTLEGDAETTEGAAFQLTLGDITEIDPDEVTQWVVHWGDGSTETFDEGGMKSHVYQDDLGQIEIKVDIVARNQTFPVAGRHLLTINNVSPTIPITGPQAVDEGSVFQINLGGVNDPGQDTVTQWIVDWGDGNRETFTSGGPRSHVYQDSAANRVITVDLRDEDGLHLEAGTRNIVVNDVAPTIAIAGPAVVNEGDSYQLTLGQITDPGDDRVTSWLVDWGDGTQQVFATGGVKSHVYQDGMNAYTIVVGLIDEEDRHENVASQAVVVNDVVPRIELDGPNSVDEGATFALNLGAIIDPGQDTVRLWQVNWGDGQRDRFTSGGTKTHVYSDGDQDYTITVDLVDENGTHASAGQFEVSVRDVAPTLDVSGASSIPVGTAYRLQLGTVADPGDDDVQEWIIDWGDGTVETFPSGGTREHVYATAGRRTITVDLVDEDAVHQDVASITVDVGGGNNTDLPGDADRDGTVGLSDFTILKENFGSGTTWEQGDFDDDGQVGLSDFTILKDNFGRTSDDPPQEPEPEPSIPGDVTNDGEVSLADFTLVKDNFGSGTTLETGDADGDGQVGLSDFTLVKDNFGRTTDDPPQQPEPEPEPEPEPGSSIPGDANRDGSVGLADFTLVKDNFGIGSTLAEGDVDGDGSVGLADFTVVKDNFGRTGPVDPANEPKNSIPGDADSDGQVGLSDFTILKDRFGSGSRFEEGDFDGDGQVGLSDFTILKDNFGAVANPAPRLSSKAVDAFFGGLGE